MPSRPRARGEQQGGAGGSDRPDDIVAGFAGYADEVVCLETPAYFFAVGQGYRNFTQTSDDEMIALLDRARDSFAEAVAIDAADPPLRDEEVRVLAGPVTVAGHLTIPEHPRGIVVFAHGSGSSRHSQRNRYVAEVLKDAGLATLLFDLLTPAEERNRSSSTSARWETLDRPGPPLMCFHHDSHMPGGFDGRVVTWPNWSPPAGAMSASSLPAPRRRPASVRPHAPRCWTC
jgi:hypothetical protein